MMHHPLDDLEAFALGDLDSDRAAAVLSHADDCTACAATLADMMAGVAALATGDPPLPLPAASRAPKSGVRQISNARHRRRPVSWWVAVAASAAAVVLGAWNLDLRATAPQVPVDALVHSHFIHHALTGTGGNAKLIQAVDGSWVYLVADGLRPIATYRLSINGTEVGSVSSDLRGRVTGFWPRRPSPVTRAEVTGPSDSRLEWAANP